MKYAIISDIHIGNNKNNPLFHKITLEYANWLRSQLHIYGVKDIIIAGDVFHDRVNINLLTLDCAHRFFDILSEFNISIVIGNHDAWFLDNSSIHSLALLKAWQNINIYDKPTEKDGIVYVPWGTLLEDIPEGEIGIGHWEIMSFEMSRTKICSHGLKAGNLMQKFSKRAFSGHFHKPQQRIYDGKTLQYTGSAFQLNWGESGNDNYVYILDKDNDTVTTIQNTVSPRHEYIRTDDDIPKIHNNFVNIHIYGTPEDADILSKITSNNPVAVRTQLIEKTELTKEEVKEQIENFKLVPVEDSIDEFSKLMESYEEDEQKEIAKRTKTMYVTLI